MTDRPNDTAAVHRLDLGFQSHGENLAGTLHLPASAPPHPAAVMLQGSGAADRESGGYFPPIRDAFLRRGIAVYSFDKPGIGGSSGDWRHFALFDRADQAQAAIAAVQDHPAIDPRRVGVWGHSQGGWIAQILASRRSDLAFAITNSGPGISLREQDIYGVEHTMRAAGSQERDDLRAGVARCRQSRRDDRDLSPRQSPHLARQWRRIRARLPRSAGGLGRPACCT